MKIEGERDLLLRCNSALSHVEHMAAMIGGAGILIITLAGCADVLLRKLFNAPITGVADFIEAWMVPIALLGMAYCQQTRTHVRMTLLVGMFNHRAATVADLVANLFGLIFICLITVGSVYFALNYFNLGGASNQLRIPLWIIAAIVPLSLILLAVRLLLQAIAAVQVLIWPGQAPLELQRLNDDATNAGGV